MPIQPQHPADTLFKDGMTPKPIDPNKIAGGFRNEANIPPAKKQLGLKIDNQKSITASLPKRPDLAAGQKQAEAINNELNEYSAKASELSLAFKKVMEDQTVPQNKSPIAKDAERELIGKLVALGTAMNNDRRDPQEGQGSMGVITMLLHFTLFQRDRINVLEYNLDQLYQNQSKLNKKLADQEKLIKELIDKPGKTG